MQVSDTFSYLTDAMASKVFAKVGKAHNLMKQFTTLAEFHDQIIVLLQMQSIVKLNFILFLRVMHVTLPLLFP